MRHALWNTWYGLRWGVRHPRIFALGLREARSDMGMTYDDNPCSARSVAYDSGRNLFHFLTLRRWDSSR